MGGRGASSGTSEMGNKYGTQYKTLLTSGNIKFVTKVNRQSETLMETMTNGRIYVHAESARIKSIAYFDKSNKRIKVIDISHEHGGIKPHTHHGYLHNENDAVRGAEELTQKEKRMVEKVTKLWEDRRGK